MSSNQERAAGQRHECPDCRGRKGQSLCFVNRGEQGCSVEQRECSRCGGVGTVSDYEHGLWMEGQKVRNARVAADLSLFEAATILRCTSAELSAIEHGRSPAHHEIIVAKLMPLVDEGQRALNNGSYCYHVERGRYCGRAETWAGHPRFHAFRATPSPTPEQQS